MDSWLRSLFAILFFLAVFSCKKENPEPEIQNSSMTVLNDPAQWGSGIGFFLGYLNDDIIFSEIFASSQKSILFIPSNTAFDELAIHLGYGENLELAKHLIKPRFIPFMGIPVESFESDYKGMTLDTYSKKRKKEREREALQNESKRAPSVPRKIAPNH